MKKKIDLNKFLYYKSPNLAKEWHPVKNGTLTPKDVTFGSNKKVWWVCKKGHEWKAAVCDRTAGYNCPYCANQKVNADNCLATVNPGLAKEWHPVKNGTLTPEHVTPGSEKKVWWKCSKGHEWFVSVTNRNSKNLGCPYCSNKKVCKDNSLATLNPQLAKEWHPEKNGILTAEDVTPGSNKKVWWICSKGHEWVTKITHRSSGSGCPYCCNRKACKDNCLATINPVLAKEWHPSKNGSLTPENVTSGSHRTAWWKCSCGAEWRTTIASRNIGNSMCPLCRKKLVESGYYKRG
jgi:hypothetical protein